MLLALLLSFFFFLMLPRPSRSTLFPYTTLFRFRNSTACDLSFVPDSRCRRTSSATQRAQLLLAPDEARSAEHTSELQSLRHLVCRLLLEKKKEDDTYPAHRGGR